MFDRFLGAEFKLAKSDTIRILQFFKMSERPQRERKRSLKVAEYEENEPAFNSVLGARKPRIKSKKVKEVKQEMPQDNTCVCGKGKVVEGDNHCIACMIPLCPLCKQKDCYSCGGAVCHACTDQAMIFSKCKLQAACAKCWDASIGPFFSGHCCEDCSKDPDCCIICTKCDVQKFKSVDARFYCCDCKFTKCADCFPRINSFCGAKQKCPECHASSDIFFDCSPFGNCDKCNEQKVAMKYEEPLSEGDY